MGPAVRGGGTPAGAARTNAELVNAGVLEKEVALLREEQTEASQVDLLLVRLHLREVAVERHVGGQALREPVFNIEAGVAAEIIGYPRRRSHV